MKKNLESIKPDKPLIKEPSTKPLIKDPIKPLLPKPDQKPLIKG